MLSRAACLSCEDALRPTAAVAIVKCACSTRCVGTVTTLRAGLCIIVRMAALVVPAARQRALRVQRSRAVDHAHPLCDSRRRSAELSRLPRPCGDHLDRCVLCGRHGWLPVPAFRPLVQPWPAGQLASAPTPLCQSVCLLVCMPANRIRPAVLV